MATFRTRAPKTIPNSRCCWVCGRPGGAGFTTALKWAGYEVKPGEMAYAHPTCMNNARQTARKEGR